MSATDELIPHDAESLLKMGKPVLLLEGGSQKIDDFVKMLASAASGRLYWQFSGYPAQVWHLDPNDKNSRDRIEREISALEGYLVDQGCRILKRFPVDVYEPPAPILSMHKVSQVSFNQEG